jgi:hypothetical protein
MKNKFNMIAGIVALVVAVPAARAQMVYQWDNGTFTERFNNSETTEVEDNWVANGFTVVDGGTRLLSITLPVGDVFVDQAVSASIYIGADISDPSGLVRIQTNDSVINTIAGDVVTLVFDPPVDLNVGDVFYASVLLPQVDGTLFPFYNDHNLVLNHSFFDVGPTQGAPYDLDSTANATANGATHPVVGAGVQSTGTTILRVNAIATP